MNYDLGQTGILYKVLMWHHLGEIFTCKTEKEMRL